MDTDDDLSQSAQDELARLRKRVAELERAEALRQAEERFAKVFHFSPVAIVIVALSDGRVIDVNEHCMELTGYHQDELIGGTVIGLDVCSEAEKRTLIVQALQNHQPIRDIEANCYSRSGIIRQVLVSAELIVLSGESCALVMFYDTTERKQIEAALRESEMRFSTVFRASPVAISISTLAEGRHIDVNDSYLAMIGYHRDEVIGHTALNLGVWAQPEDRERMAQTLREQGSVQNLEVKQRTRSGELRDVLASVEVIDLGSEPCVLAFLHDITARKRAERRLAVQYAVSQVLVE